MKKRVSAAFFATLLAAACLAGCSAAPESSSSQPASSAPSSSAPSSSSSALEDDTGPSYDMDAWSWHGEDFSGHSILLPDGVYIEGDKIHEEYAVFPESLFKLNNFPGIVAWVRPGSLASSDITKTSDTVYHFTPFEGTARDLTLSDDETLPEDTFYLFEDYIAYTFIGGVGGDGTRATMLKQTVYVPREDGIVVTFYAEVGSTEGKPLFERIVGSIEKSGAEVVSPALALTPAAYTVDADGGLNLRSGPGTDYESLQLIPDGGRVTAQGSTGDAASSWIFVNYNGVEGWVSTEYLEAE